MKWILHMIKVKGRGAMGYDKNSSGGAPPQAAVINASTVEMCCNANKS